MLQDALQVRSQRKPVLRAGLQREPWAAASIRCFAPPLWIYFLPTQDVWVLPEKSLGVSVSPVQKGRTLLMDTLMVLFSPQAKHSRASQNCQSPSFQQLPSKKGRPRAGKSSSSIPPCSRAWAQGAELGPGLSLCPGSCLSIADLEYKICQILHICSVWVLLPASLAP